MFRVSAMCRVLEASKGGFYAWIKRVPSTRMIENQELQSRIVEIHIASDGRYGSPKIHGALRNAGEHYSRKRVARLMREAGIVGLRCKRFTPTTTDSNHDEPIAENLLARRFSPEEIGAPNRCWAGDITYIRTGEGWLYLAVVLDLFSRLVIGWSMSHSMKSRFVIDALQMAINRRNAPAGLLWHSDRGIQYVDSKTRALADRNGIRCSMSRKGNCWDNAVIESFWASLKAELFATYVPATREEARAMIFHWIEIWYNRQRLHSTLGYLTPEQFDQQNVA